MLAEEALHSSVPAGCADGKRDGSNLEAKSRASWRAAASCLGFWAKGLVVQASWAASPSATSRVHLTAVSTGCSRHACRSDGKLCHEASDTFSLRTLYFPAGKPEKTRITIICSWVWIGRLTLAGLLGWSGGCLLGGLVSASISQLLRRRAPCLEVQVAVLCLSFFFIHCRGPGAVNER